MDCYFYGMKDDLYHNDYIYGIHQKFNGDICFTTTVDKIESEMAREETDKMTKEFIDTSLKETKGIKDINSQSIEDKSRNPVGGARKGKMFSVKSAYKSKYF